MMTRLTVAGAMLLALTAAAMAQTATNGAVITGLTELGSQIVLAVVIGAATALVDIVGKWLDRRKSLSIAQKQLVKDRMNELFANAVDFARDKATQLVDEMPDTVNVNNAALKAVITYANRNGSSLLAEAKASPEDIENRARSAIMRMWRKENKPAVVENNTTVIGDPMA